MDLVVNDEYYAVVGKLLKTQEELLAKAFNDYCLIMRTVSEQGIMEGATADSLKEFVGQVRLDLTENAENYSLFDGTAAIRCSEFIESIDTADGDLY